MRPFTPRARPCCTCCATTWNRCSGRGRSSRPRAAQGAHAGQRQAAGSSTNSISSSKGRQAARRAAAWGSAAARQMAASAQVVARPAACAAIGMTDGMLCMRRYVGCWEDCASAAEPEGGTAGRVCHMLLAGVQPSDQPLPTLPTPPATPAPPAARIVRRGPASAVCPGHAQAAAAQPGPAEQLRAVGGRGVWPAGEGRRPGGCRPACCFSGQRYEWPACASGLTSKPACMPCTSHALQLSIYARQAHLPGAGQPAQRLRHVLRP